MTSQQAAAFQFRYVMSIYGAEPLALADVLRFCYSMGSDLPARLSTNADIIILGRECGVGIQHPRVDDISVLRGGIVLKQIMEGKTCGEH